MYVPPLPGSAAPSSLQTSPSHRTSTAATTQATMACGPPMEAMNSGMVMNGPMPTMLATLSDVAWSSPSPRSRPGSRRGGSSVV